MDIVDCYFMINQDDALRLLRQYVNDEKIIKHCIGVANIAFGIALKIKAKNFLEINPDRVKIAALLHDIGKFKDGIHEINTVEILKNEGLDYIAKIAMHGFAYEIFLLKGEESSEYLPKNLENKIVVLADMYYNQDEKRVSLDERLLDIKERYRNDKDFMKVLVNGETRMRILEDEIKLLM
ncbi:MAG: HD domain-containing protein [bacterium]